MKNVLFLFGIIFLLFASSCTSKSESEPEAWAGKKVNDWPTFTLTNKITFGDTSYMALANSFLVNTGTDTIGVSCKHIFMVFGNYQGYERVQLKGDFVSWHAYVKDNPDNELEFTSLINENPNETIGQFNTLKDRDWILFHTEDDLEGFPSLKIRYTPLKKGEVVYACGWCTMADDTCKLVHSKLRVYKSMGNYYYMETLTTDGSAKGTSGSPVVDKNGYLVGIVSGAEGKLGVIGSVQYLQSLFDQYHITYSKES